MLHIGTEKNLMKVNNAKPCKKMLLTLSSVLLDVFFSFFF